MGRAVTRVAQAAEIPVVGAVDAPSSPFIGRDVGEVAGVGVLGVAIGADLASALLGADVLVDFSTPAAFTQMLQVAMHAGVAVVSGTTGLKEREHELMAKAAKRVPTLWAPNMSIGVQVLTELVQEAVRALGPTYDVEIVETHHSGKRDAPSGTAKQLIAAVREARTTLGPKYGRKGKSARRHRDDLGVHAVRGGGVIGDHTVHLLGGMERLEITHRAIRRDVFAAGALRAARFVRRQRPGRYRLSDVIADRK